LDGIRQAVAQRRHVLLSEDDWLVFGAAEFQAKFVVSAG
jgi:hypothetical protein